MSKPDSETIDHVKVLIHKGSNEIGGTCIQLSTGNTSILIDLGLPLSKESKLFNLSEIKADALLISHPHQDHYGLIDSLDISVPVYIGSVGKKLIEASRILLGRGLYQNNFIYFNKNEKIVIGDFSITPYLVDHSAVDAYGFLIEAKGKRIFYSGDFRAHGKKSILFEKIVADPPENINLLFMEGSMLNRSNDDFPTEDSVENKIYETIKDQKNITFLICSSQNIDRIVSAYRACLKTGKVLIIDIYTAWILEKLKEISNRVPAMDWKGIRVYADFSQDRVLKINKDYFGDFRKRVYTYRIHKEEIKNNLSQYLVLTKMSKFKTIDSYRGNIPVNVIYSQWKGYLGCSNAEYYGAEKISAYQHDKEINFVYAHTSGHATVRDLQTFAAALKPRILIPIHTEYKGEFKNYFDNVVEMEDGSPLIL